MRTKDPKTVSYESIEPKLRTGDVFLFHGKSDHSKAIEQMTGSRFSHASMVIRPDVNKPPYLWQTGPTKITRDVVKRVGHGGAQLGELRDVLFAMDAYNDVPYLRRLKFRRTPDFETMAMYVVADMDGRPFPNLDVAFKQLQAGKRGFSRSDRTLFCAELVAETFMRLGLLSFDPPPNSYVPKKFSPQYPLKLLKGATFGPEVRVALPKKP